MSAAPVMQLPISSGIPDYSFDIERMQPGLVRDDLGRTGIARSIADFIRDPANQHVHVVGIYGTWGAGKSQVLGLVAQHLLADNQRDGNEQIIVCPFVPWRYELEGDLGVGLVKALQSIEKRYAEPRGPGAVRPSGALYNPHIMNPQKIVKDGHRLIDTIITTLQTSNNMQVALAAGVASAVKQHIHRGEVSGIRREMQDLVDDITNYHGGRATSRLVVFIDDLDRCSPVNLVHMFEWMKVHLNADRCTYVVALDHVAAARAIVGHYHAYLEKDPGLAFGLRYLEKLVDIEYELEPNTRVETMALTRVKLRNASSMTRISELARSLHGGDFQGSPSIDRLMSMRSLRNPRTMLKIVTKFEAAMNAFKSQSPQFQGRFASSYPFWLLFLVTMYYRLDPDVLAEFVDGRGYLYNFLAPGRSASASPQALASASAQASGSASNHMPANAGDQIPGDWATDPKREFWEVATAIKSTSSAALALLSDRENLQDLISIVRQNVYVEQEQG